MRLAEIPQAMTTQNVAAATDCSRLDEFDALSMPLRIGILMDHPSPHMVALINALAARWDCAAEVLYCRGSAPERSWGAPAGKLPYRFLKGIGLRNGFRFNPGILKALARVPADVWILNSVYTSASTLLAAWWLKRRGIPIAFMNEPVRTRGRMLAWLKAFPLRFVLERSDAILTMGHKAAGMYGELCPEPKPIDCVPYYLDLSGFLRLPAPEATGSPIEFFCCSQMIPRKGLDVLLQACGLLPHEGWRLTIAGDGRLFQELKDEFAARWPPDQVRLVGQIPFEDRCAGFAGKHVFVFPSRWDGWGMVIPEALAAGLPVICTNQVISAHEFIVNDKNGFVIPADNPLALAEKMLWFIRNASAIPTMSKAARHALREYQPELGAERLVRRASQLTQNVCRIKAEQAGKVGASIAWQELTKPSSTAERILGAGRKWARDSVIQASRALNPNRPMTGNRILVGHVVLPEDKPNFRNQIRFLSDHFEICLIPELAELAQRHANAARHALAITFDDGFRILMDDCLEVLEQFGIKATFLVPTGFIDSSGNPAETARLNYTAHPHLKISLEPMRPEDLRTLVTLGHDVCSHGISHTSIQAMTELMALREMTDSRRRIEEWTGKSPHSFAFPYGHTTSTIFDPAACLRSAGYSFGLTLQRGTVEGTSNPLLLPRDHFEGSWPIGHLRYFLSSSRIITKYGSTTEIRGCRV
jgi:poly(glycerol-phosphate) alpha-glucosyltransferase